jgi:hypothetical protein
MPGDDSHPPLLENKFVLVQLHIPDGLKTPCLPYLPASLLKDDFPHPLCVPPHPKKELPCLNLHLLSETSGLLPKRPCHPT